MGPPVKIEVDVLGDVVLSRRLLRVAENAADLSDAFDTILDTFEEWTGEQFDSRGGTFGTPWDPLADSTIESKTRAGYADPEQPLVATGALALSLQGGPGGVHEVGPEGATWGTRNPNAMWHHGRDRSGTNPVPRRPIFELDEIRRRWIMGVLHRSVFEAGALR
jgi:hypothetical protein